MPGLPPNKQTVHAVECQAQVGVDRRRSPEKSGRRRSAHLLLCRRGPRRMRSTSRAALAACRRMAGIAPEFFPHLATRGPGSLALSSGGGRAAETPTLCTRRGRPRESKADRNRGVHMLAKAPENTPVPGRRSIRPVAVMRSASADGCKPETSGTGERRALHSPARRSPEGKLSASKYPSSSRFGGQWRRSGGASPAPRRKMGHGGFPMGGVFIANSLRRRRASGA